MATEESVSYASRAVALWVGRQLRRVIEINGHDGSAGGDSGQAPLRGSLSIGRTHCSISPSKRTLGLAEDISLVLHQNNPGQWIGRWRKGVYTVC